MAVLPTGFGKSIIYQSFVIAKDFANTASIVVLFRFAVLLKTSCSQMTLVTALIMVVVPLRSIIEDQLQSNDFGIKAVAFKKIPQLLKDIGANKYNVIFASAEQALTAEFTAGCLNMIFTTAFQLSCATFLIRLITVFDAILTDRQTGLK